MKAYKGFNQDMTCRGFKYEEGKEYEENKADCCHSGFHACEYPLDLFGYYPPSSSVYHVVEQDGEINRDIEDSKVASTKIKIGARIDIRGLVHAAIEYTRSKTNFEHTDQKMATAGDYGAAAAGNYGAAAAGYSGTATAGNYGAAIAGDYGAATAGNYGAATAGYSGTATAGNYGAAAAGNSGAATAGYKGAATAGYKGAATAGNYGAAMAGDYGTATSRGKAESGKNGLSVARGNGCQVKGGLGSILVIAEEKDDNCDIKYWKAVVVDGEKVKPDTWYSLKNNRLVEVKREK